MERICVVGDLQDLTLVYVAWMARQRHIEVIELAEETLGVDWSFCVHGAGQGEIQLPDRRLAFAELDGAFVRFNPNPAAPSKLGLAELQAQAFISERRHGLHQFLAALPCAVANRSAAGRSNASKPLQMRILSQAGFSVPRWIATNSADEAAAFLRTCPDGAIYKACSGFRSRVQRPDDSLMQKFAAGTTPVIVQEFIPGLDVRVHTVGRRAFPTVVLSSDIDYRVQREKTRYQAGSIPADVMDLCIRVAAAEGLLLSGFDFRVTPQNEWYCLEVNPAPMFLPYEFGAGQPICSAVVDALTERAPSRASAAS